MCSTIKGVAVFMCLAVETHYVLLSPPDSEQMNLSLFPKERSFPSFSLRPLPSSVSIFRWVEKMEHGNYGNCIRQVLSRSSAPRAFWTSVKAWTVYKRCCGQQCNLTHKKTSAFLLWLWLSLQTLFFHSLSDVRLKSLRITELRQRECVCVCWFVMLFFGNRTPYTSLLLPLPFHQSPLLSRMLICWCAYVAPPFLCGGGGPPPSVLSFCPWIKQLPLSLFSHGSRRSVHTSTAAKAFQSVQHITRHRRFRLSTPVSLADVSACCYSCCLLPVCVCVCTSSFKSTVTLTVCHHWQQQWLLQGVVQAQQLWHIALLTMNDFLMW